jgi:hypothetical protein
MVLLIASPALHVGVQKVGTLWMGKGAKLLPAAKDTLLRGIKA